MVDWHFMFMNKTVREQVATFNNILMDIFSNYIPCKYIAIKGYKRYKRYLKKSLCKSKNFIELYKHLISLR